MKVLQVLPSLAAGGAEGFVTNLGVSLVALGVEVKSYLLGGVRGKRGGVLQERLVKAGIEVVGTKERYPGSAGNLLQLASTLRSWQPDIVQVNLFQSEMACAAARFLALNCKARYVRRLANTDFIAYHSLTIVRAMDRFYPHVIACSEPVAEAYRAFMGGKQRGRLSTIPNGGSLLDSPPDREATLDTRKSLGIADNAFVVTHIGRMFGGGDAKHGGLKTGQKAHDVLIHAFARAFADVPESTLILVGEGPLRSEVEALAADVGIADKTRFVGELPTPWPALIAADVFCFPSRYEGLPNVLPEAASAGLPVVASDIPEIRGMDPDAAWFLEPVGDVSAFARTLRKIRDELPEYTRRANEAASGFRERFSMESCARAYMQVYSEAIAASPRFPAHGPVQK